MIARPRFRSAPSHVRRLLDPATAACFIYRNDRIDSVNDTLLQLLGAAHLNEVLGRSPREFVAPDARARMKRWLSRWPRWSRHVPGIEVPLIRLDGQALTVDVTITASADRHGPFLHVFLRERAGREALEAVLPQQAQLIELAFEPILLWDWDQGILIWNRGCEQLYGYTPTEARGQVSHDLLATRFPDSRAAFEAALLRDGQWAGELRHRTRTGLEIRVESRMQLLRQGEHRWVMEANRDITERKATEEALRQRVEELTQLQALLDPVPAAVFVTRDPDCRTIIGNRWANQIFDATPGENLSATSISTGHRYFTPDGQELTAAELPMQRACATNQALRDVEIRTVLPDGRTIDLLGSAVPLRTAKGEVRGCVGTFLDITARRQAEEGLRHAEGRYRLLHENLLRDAFVQVDMTTGRILDCNELYCQLVGYTRSELHTMTSVDLTPHRWQAMEAAIVETQIRARGYSDLYEKEYRRKNGTLVPIEFRVIRVPRVNGEPECLWGLVRDITERKRIEAALRASERRFRAIFDHQFQYSVLLTPDGRLIEMSDSIVRGTGATREDVIGQPFLEGPWWRNLPESLAQWQRQFDEALTRPGPARGEAAYWAKEGTLRHSLNIVTAWRNEQGDVEYLLCEGLDITERKAAEAALSRSSDFVRSVLDSLPALVVVIDHNGMITAANESWQRVARDSDGDPAVLSVGANYLEVCRRASMAGDHAAQAALEALEAVRSGRQPGTVLEYACPMPDGERWFIMDVRRLHEGDGGMVVSHVDITERKRAEQALQEADHRKDEFLAMLAHELRNPLAPIRNGLYVLQKTCGNTPRAAQLLTMIQRQVTHLVRMVDDLLDISRITRGKIALKKERVRWATVLSHALELSRPLIDAQQHTLTVFSPPEPWEFHGDPVRLTQVFANLLNNAAKYTLPGGQISVSAERRETEAVIAIRDTGIGLAAELLPRVFDLFTQAERGLDRAQGGLGIGLALVRNLVKLHGGRVTAASDGPGQGSEFRVYLPLLPLGDDEAPARRPPPGSATTGSGEA